MIKQLSKYALGIAVAAGSYIFYQGADARYVKKALADFPVWETQQIADCQTKLGGTQAECQCLVDKTLAWNTDASRPAAGTTIWDHRYIQAIYHSDAWNEGVLHDAIYAEIENEVGDNNMNGQKAGDIYDRYFDEVIQAVTFKCFEGDKAYRFWDKDQTWDDVVEITDMAYLVGRGRAAEPGASN